MVSTVGTRPTHYEMLGLTPTASSEEIAQAFAREIGMFRVRPFGGLAAVSVAYETLRDPARRRAYDVAIGVAPEPAKQPETSDWAPFMIRASAHPAERRAVDPLHRPAPLPAPEPEARPEPPVDPRLAAIAASVRALAKRDASAASPAPTPTPEPLRSPEPGPAPEPAPLRAPEPRPRPDAGLQRSADWPVHRVELELIDDDEASPIEWKRPAMIGGWLIVGVGIIGALAGVMAGNEAVPKQPERGVTTVLPKAKAAAEGAVESAALTFAPAAAEAAPVRRARTVAHRPWRKAPLQQRPLTDKELDALPPVEVSQRAADATAAPAVAEAGPAPVTQAKMPLPNSVIARTIGRIGYSCGSVASVVAGEGPGVYKVTCSSGHSYRAAPVRGRYHFSRSR